MGGGGGGGSHPDPEIRGRRSSGFSLVYKKGGRAPRTPPLDPPLYLDPVYTGPDKFLNG